MRVTNVEVTIIANYIMDSIISDITTSLSILSLSILRSLMKMIILNNQY